MENPTSPHIGHQGPETDIEKSRSFETFEQAEQLYLSAFQRLMNVNGWNALTGSLSDQYELLNASATPKMMNAEEGDFIRVKIAEDKRDHEEEVLRVERIITKLLGHNRSVSLVTKPVRIKRLPDRVEHVVGRDLSYTFVVQLNETLVTAGVYIKDEAPAENTSGLYDKISNSLKEFFGSTPVYKNQWGALMEAMLK